jgi:hypothetical protein
MLKLQVYHFNKNHCRFRCKFPEATKAKMAMQKTNEKVIRIVTEPEYYHKIQCIESLAGSTM